MKKAVFLDRDGTIIKECNYLCDPDKVILIDGAVEALKLLAENGFILVIVSNQSGVARGYFDVSAVEVVNKRLIELLKTQGVNISGLYYCPHHPNGTVAEYSLACECRKPKIKMAQKASQDLDIDLAKSYMIGDKLADVKFGCNFGAKKSILVLTGHGPEEFRNTNMEDIIIAENIGNAAELIVRNESSFDR